METKHTKEPWHVNGVTNGKIVGDDTVAAEKYHINGANVTIARVYRASDAARLRECVNACAGIQNPSAIAECIAVMRDMAHMVEECGYNGSNGVTERSHIKRARKALAKLRGE